MEYRISYKDPHKHFVDLELIVDQINSNRVYIQLPAWRPGRYELQNYARNIQRFSIVDEHGNSVSWKKVTRDRWEVDTKGISSISIKYNYYCCQMDAGGSWLDDEQLYLNFINCALYSIGRENDPCKVHLDIPPAYQIACGLPLKGSTLQAESYYHLVDAPLFASASLQHKTYHVSDISFHIWFQGNFQPNWDQISSDFAKFTAQNLEVFGEFPEKDYHFLFQILPYKHYHGVEHRNSTVITLGPAENFHSKELYESFLGVSCHELFHAWNALKIRPKELLPYDFTRENYFRTGYVIEGVTTYYGDLLLARSGVFSLEQYFNELNNAFKKHFDNFGRFNLSLADSSFDLWIDGYSLGIPNRKVSIYGKGAIAALILDLEIRRATQSTRSLDDLMRLMWEEFGKKEKGYTEEDYQRAAESVAGTSLDAYFKLCIYGTDDLIDKLNELLHFAGCALVTQPNPLPAERLFGLRAVVKDGRYFVEATEPGSPADQLLTKDDELISIDNAPVNLLSDKETIEIQFKRSGRIYSHLLVSDKQDHFNEYRITKREDASDEEKRHFKIWLNMEF